MSILLPSPLSRTLRAAQVARLMKAILKCSFLLSFCSPSLPNPVKLEDRTLGQDRHEFKQSLSLQYPRQGQLFYNHIMIPRTNEITSNVLRPQTQHSWVFFHIYQIHCKREVCDKHYELEPSGCINMQNGRGGGEKWKEYPKRDLGLVCIWSLMSSFAYIMK